MPLMNLSNKATKMNAVVAHEVLERLAQRWPDAKLELDYSNAFELLIATILAAQCTDTRVNAVTKTFFKEYPAAHKIVDEELDIIAAKIKPTGFYRAKAKNIKACCEKLMRDFKGQVPSTMEELITLPGVGRKTANLVLANAFDKQTIAVDTHIQRVARRLDMTQSENPEQIEKDLMQLLEQQHWTLFTRLMILHGRYVCKARKPLCSDCALDDLCYSDDKTRT
jgi:endonuclease III